MKHRPFAPLVIVVVVVAAACSGGATDETTSTASPTVPPVLTTATTLDTSSTSTNPDATTPPPATTTSSTAATTTTAGPPPPTTPMPSTATTTTTTTTTTQPPPRPAWQRADLDGLGDIQAVAALPGRYVIAGRRGRAVEVSTSPDGAEWTTVETSLPRRTLITDVVATPDRYLAIGWSETSTDVMWESPDLVEWEPVTLPCRAGALADLIDVEGDTVLIAGLCDGTGTTWTFTRVGAQAEANPSPFAGGYEIAHDGEAWYVLSGEGLWRSRDALTWTAVRLPAAADTWSSMATFEGSLFLAADALGQRGRVWRLATDAWARVGGTFAAGEDLYTGATVRSGPAGILVAWDVGYPPSAHTEQSPAVIERDGWTVLLYRTTMPIAAEIVDGDGVRVLTVDFPEPGAAPPDGVEIDEAAETVRFLDPGSVAVLVELTFDEIEEAIRLDRPQRHAWWSSDGAAWTEIEPPPVGHLHSTAVGTTSVVAAEQVTVRTLPPWVSKLSGEAGEDVGAVWLWVPD